MSGNSQTFQASPVPVRYRFGTFELDTQSGELRRNGVKLRCRSNPFWCCASFWKARASWFRAKSCMQPSGPQTRLWTSTPVSIPPSSGCARYWVIRRTCRFLSKPCHDGAIVSLLLFSCCKTEWSFPFLPNQRQSLRLLLDAFVWGCSLRLACSLPNCRFGPLRILR